MPRDHNRKKRNISMRTSLQVRIRFSNANSATINITYDELFVRAYLLTHVIANDAFVGDVDVSFAMRSKVKIVNLRLCCIIFVKHIVICRSYEYFIKLVCGNREHFKCLSHFGNLFLIKYF